MSYSMLGFGDTPPDPGAPAGGCGGHSTWGYSEKHGRWDCWCDDGYDENPDLNASSCVPAKVATPSVSYSLVSRAQAPGAVPTPTAQAPSAMPTVAQIGILVLVIAAASGGAYYWYKH
jgi:hypothetical protein